MIRYASVCSGVEAFSLAVRPLDWECAFLSEVDPFPRAVLEQRFPNVPMHGDFTEIEADQCPDGPRYKAIGNSMAVPVFEWLARRIDAVDNMVMPEPFI